MRDRVWYRLISFIIRLTVSYKAHPAFQMRLFLAVFLLGTSSNGWGQKHKTEEPFFASHAVYIYLGPEARSPDGRRKVSIRVTDDNASDFPSEIRVKTPNGSLLGQINFGLNAQVLWSPDSKAFAITGSSDGGNGQYHTDVFLLRPGKLVKVPLTGLIERAFGHPVKCAWPESPNVVAVRWLKDSKALLVAAQIINHSNCDSNGTFKGFAVDTQTAQVIRSYGQLDVKRLFPGDLGPWLKDAEDSCITDPKSCYVSTDHP